ncbi:MAG: hypothetical protein N3I86_14900 [Verrucomicrobiae bacterium]|nr:hypothetical protein [Verrucomicrobiae bacterium]
MNTEQLELGLNQESRPVTAGRRESRIARAAWWFAQMRQIVDRAMDWQQTPPGRPEQTWLPNSHREVRV